MRLLHFAPFNQAWSEEVPFYTQWILLSAQSLDPLPGALVQMHAVTHCGMPCRVMLSGEESRKRSSEEGPRCFIK